MNEKNIAVILLAAGASTRMGKSKQLLSIGGQPLLRKSAEAATESGVERVIVVLGSGEELHRQVLGGLSVEIISNPDWQGGMGTSIHAGLGAASDMVPNLDAVIIVVCDQPLLSGSHLKKLLTQYWTTGARIVASAYAGTVGVPALFDKTVFSKLLSLPAEHGARKILTEYGESIVSVPFPDGAIDLDTPEDYRPFEDNLGTL